MKRVSDAGLEQPESMTLATATRDGKPSARVVLLKSVGNGCFRFFTNYESRKAEEMLANPRAQLLFYRAEFGEQIRIEGTVRKAPADVSDEYFSLRPRGSRIGAIASKQSRPLGSVEEMRARFAEVEREHANDEVPRPENWGGFELVPSRFEFWYDRPDRMHERVTYERDPRGEWVQGRLWP